MADILETLLQRIQEGTASPDEMDQARVLLDAQERDVSGTSVHDAVHHYADSGAIDISGAVFQALGLELEPVGEAVRIEAGTVDVTAGVMAALAGEGLLLGTQPAVAAALAHEAGSFDDASSVLAALGLEEGLPVAEAVRHEAGEVDLAADVLAQIGAEWSSVADAVRSEAGEIDIADAVMASLARPEAMPSSVTTAPDQPAPVNNTRRWVAAVFAAAMVAVVLGVGGLGSMVGGGLLIGSQLGGSSTNGGMDIASNGGHKVLAPSKGMIFASAAEVVVEDLSFGDDVIVFQDEGDDGALILWVDEEVL